MLNVIILSNIKLNSECSYAIMLNVVILSVILNGVMLMLIVVMVIVFL